jgi:SAM-dependent methyltransferase
VELSAVKQPQRSTSSAGAYAAVGSRILLTSELLCESVDLHAGERVLDVGCGSGNAALAAARRFCRVVGVDGDPDLLERARRRAEVEGLEVTFLEGEAEDLPFPDGSFEAVLSAGEDLPGRDLRHSAAELLRVCRPGGRIGMVHWAPGATSASCSRPSAGTGCRRASRRLSRGAARSGCGRCSGPPWPSPPRGAACCGASPRPSTRWCSSPASTARPTRALQALGPDRAGALKAELLEVARRFDVSEDDTLVLQLDYLEVVVRKPVWL